MRDERAEAQPTPAPRSRACSRARRRPAGSPPARAARRAAGARRASGREPVARLRQGVELTEDDVAFLRSLSRPARTGQPRTLGSKFVATGVLAAAIELLRDGEIDMHGVEAGDLDEMTAAPATR